MRVNATHPANWPALSDLDCEPGTEIEVVPSASIPEDEVSSVYFECGSHPDIVKYVWEELGSAIPADGSCLINGYPALVHPTVGVLLAVCLGTEYAIRVPGAQLKTALAAGYSQVIKWGGRESTDLRKDFGPCWVFGCFERAEREWCLELYREFEAKQGC